jgi:hypothetical protein
MTWLRRSLVVAARFLAPLSFKGFRHSAWHGRISPPVWSLLPGAPALTRTDLSSARTTRLRSGRTIATFHDLTGRPGPSTWQLGAYPDGAGEQPVGGVSWYEAVAYAEFAGKSLPTVDEWNRAAGIGVNSDILQLSNFGGKAAAPAGKHRGMAPFGTYDMAGNLKEWTTNASSDRRYFLGGAWDEPPYQFTVPDARTPFTRENTFGFRCVQRSTSPGDIYNPVARPSAPPRIKPVDDESYRVFLDLHTYEKSALDSRVERTDESSPYWRRETVTFRAAYGNERVIAHLFLPRNMPVPYQVIAVMGGSTITDMKRIEDFDYPYEFILRSGRAVIIPAYSGTLERGPTLFSLPANQERERALKWSMDLGRSVDYLETRPDIWGPCGRGRSNLSSTLSFQVLASRHTGDPVVNGLRTIVSVGHSSIIDVPRDLRGRQGLFPMPVFRSLSDFPASTIIIQTV